MALYQGKELEMVEVRKYSGVEDNKHAWIFLGYDFVKKEKNGKARSILAKDDVEYDYLPRIANKEDRHYGLYDHDAILEGDVRVVTSSIGRFLNDMPVVSTRVLRTWIAHNDKYSFVYETKSKEKVKTLRTKN